MSLTGICSPESARRKFFMNSKYIISRGRNQTFLGSAGLNESTGICSPESAIRKLFMNSSHIMSRK